MASRYLEADMGMSRISELTQCCVSTADPEHGPWYVLHFPPGTTQAQPTDRTERQEYHVAIVMAPASLKCVFDPVMHNELQELYPILTGGINDCREGLN